MGAEKAKQAWMFYPRRSRTGELAEILRAIVNLGPGEELGLVCSDSEHAARTMLELQDLAEKLGIALPATLRTTTLEKVQP